MCFDDGHRRGAQLWKREVSFEETARQRNTYLVLVNGMSNSIVIYAVQSLERVVMDVGLGILDFLRARIRKRLD